MGEAGDEVGERAPVRLEFELTPDDLVGATVAWMLSPAGERYLADAAERSRRSAWYVAALSALATYGAIAVLLDINGADAREFEETLAFGLIACVVGIGVFVASVLRKTAQNRLISSAARERAASLGPGHAGRVCIRIDDRGAVYEDETVTATYAWPAFREITTVDGYTIMVAFNERGFIVPDRVFACAAERDGFVDDCRARNEATGGVDTAVAAFLANRDLNCVGCGYQLRGVRGAACPECGKQIEPPGYAALVSPDLLRRITKTGRP